MDHNRKTTVNPPPENKKLHRSIFELPSHYLDSCRLIKSPSTNGAVISDHHTGNNNNTSTTQEEEEEEEDDDDDITSNGERLSCNTCKSTFVSLQDQRTHSSSDFHRFNAKLALAGKDTLKENELDETSYWFGSGYDISSISGGSEDEYEKHANPCNHMNNRSSDTETKLFVRLPDGDVFSVWKCLFVHQDVKILHEQDQCSMPDSCITERDLVERLRGVLREPRNKTHLRVILLASRNHFAGCVFDGNAVVISKTIHRYHKRAKAGKMQSSKDDPSAVISNSAGASIRQYKELPLKKEIRELLTSWKPYFDASSSIFIHATSDSRLLLFDDDTPCFSYQKSAVRCIPLTVPRPTFKEAVRVYSILTEFSIEYHDAKQVEVAQKALLTGSQSNIPQMSQEERLKQERREERAAAAERRIAALQSSNSISSQPNTISKVSSAGDSSRVECITLKLEQKDKRIRVKTLNGIMITLIHAEGLEDVLDIKDLFYEVPPNRQIFFVNGHELDCMKSLEMFLKPNDTIRMKLNTVIEVLVQKSNGIMEAAYVDTVSSVSSAKDRIQNRVGLLPHEFELVCCGKFLHPERNIIDYNIFPGSVLDVVVHGPSNKTIHLENSFGDEYPMQMTRDTTVADLESFILEKNLNIYGQKLFYKGRRLSGTKKKLSSYYIEDCGVVRIVEKPSDTIPVEVYIDFREVLSGEEDECIETITWEMVPGADTVLNLMTYIKKKLHIPFQNQKVFLPFTSLKNLNSTLGEYDIRHESRISVVSSEMRIYIKNGLETFPLRINSCKTVHKLKRKIESKKRIHSNFQLTFFEEELEDARTLKSYGIDWNFTVTLVEKEF